MLILHSSADFFDGMSLKDAFWQFVLHDPEVKILGRKAIKADSGLNQVYLRGWCYPSGCREWPVVFAQGSLAGGRSPNSPIGHLAGRPPQAVQRAADLVCLRYSLLLTLLRHKELEAIGDPLRSRGTDRILPSIWSHRSYYIDAENGDVLQIKNSDIADCNDFLKKRWRAVMLERPLQASMFHEKPPTSDAAPPATMGHAFARSSHKLSPVRASIAQAIKAIWPNGIPMGVAVKTRDENIRKWQADNGFAVASTKTIDRHLKNKN